METKFETYNKDELINESTRFINQFTALTKLTPKNKLGVSNSNELFIDFLENGHIQAWLRKITGQSRIVINNYLEKELYDYYLFLLYLKHLKDLTNSDDIINGIIETHIAFLANMNKGLEILSDIYPDYPKLISTCSLYKTRFLGCINMNN